MLINIQRAATLYEDYSKWAASNNDYVITSREFSRRLQDHGFKTKDTTDRASARKGVFVLGVQPINGLRY